MREQFEIRFTHDKLKSIEKIIISELYNTEVYFQYKEKIPEDLLSNPNVMEERLMLTQKDLWTILLINDGLVSFKLEKTRLFLLRILYSSSEETTYMLISKDFDVCIRFRVQD